MDSMHLNRTNPAHDKAAQPDSLTVIWFRKQRERYDQKDSSGGSFPFQRPITKSTALVRFPIS